MREIFRCETTVYRVEPENDSWYEYKAELYREWDLIDSWDSLHETYNGVKGQRLSFDKAREAAAEIREGVDNGNAHEWFDVPVTIE